MAQPLRFQHRTDVLLNVDAQLTGLVISTVATVQAQGRVYRHRRIAGSLEGSHDGWGICQWVRVPTAT
jgi:hypothetical protein